MTSSKKRTSKKGVAHQAGGERRLPSKKRDYLCGLPSIVEFQAQKYLEYRKKKKLSLMPEGIEKLNERGMLVLWATIAFIFDPYIFAQKLADSITPTQQQKRSSRFQVRTLNLRFGTLDAKKTFLTTKKVQMATIWALLARDPAYYADLQSFLYGDQPLNPAGIRTSRVRSCLMTEKDYAKGGYEIHDPSWNMDYAILAEKDIEWNPTTSCARPDHRSAEAEALIVENLSPRLRLRLLLAAGAEIPILTRAFMQGGEEYAKKRIREFDRRIKDTKKLHESYLKRDRSERIRRDFEENLQEDLTNIHKEKDKYIRFQEAFSRIRKRIMDTNGSVSNREIWEYIRQEGVVSDRMKLANHADHDFDYVTLYKMALAPEFLLHALMDQKLIQADADRNDFDKAYSDLRGYERQRLKGREEIGWTLDSIY